MAQNTNLNVSPYYDDFDKDKNFYRVLFRPGFPIQARELTTMQSVLQRQVESVGQHLFKDGAMVIPGQVGYDLNVDAIMLQESFLGANVEDYRTQLAGKIIEGLTSGIKAKVLYTVSETESEKNYITLYVKYIESGGEGNTQTVFSDNEQLVTDTEITFGTSLIEVGSPFAQLLPTSSIQSGSVAYIQEGVYFIRGFFVDVPYQYILLDQYGTTPQYRIGLDILESIVTPEDDSSLNDNAAGTSNYAAPGSHRFKVSTRLSKKLLSDDADKDFIELLRINGSRVENLVDRSAYNELERTMATRTYEESGDYTVNDFQILMRENLDDGFNNGVYEAGAITSGGNTAAEKYYSVEIGPGAAYVKGYRIKTLSPTYVDLLKPRVTDARQNGIIPFELGNYSNVDNIWGFPNFTGSSVSNAYQTVEFRDSATVTPGVSAGNIIGYGRFNSLEYSSDTDQNFGNANDRYKANLFDVQMITILQLASQVNINEGSMIRGASSGATGLVVGAESSDDHIQIYQVNGSFQDGEMTTIDGIALDVIVDTYKYQYSDSRQIVGRDEGTQQIEFTADLILEDNYSINGATFTYDDVDGDVLTVDTLVGGTGYPDTGTAIVTTASGSGTGLTLDFTASSGVITSTTINVPGTGYVVDETITITNSRASGVNTLGAIATAGTGYTATTGLATTSAGSGTGLIVDITADANGAVQTVAVNSSALSDGSGYANAELITITNVNASGIATIDTISAADASRTEGTYTITASDYTTDASGSGATFTIAVDGTGAATIVITDDGTGFVVDETFTIVDGNLGGGGGASLTFDVATIHGNGCTIPVSAIHGNGATVDIASVGTHQIVGLNSNFGADLRPGDRIYFSETTFVDVDKVNPASLSTSSDNFIFDNANQIVNVTPPSANFPTPGTFTAAIRYRASLFGNEETTDLITQMPKEYIRSISDESMTVRRTFDSQTPAGDSVSITLPENEQFSAISAVNFSFTVLGSSNASYPVGSQIPLATGDAGAFGFTSFTSADRTTLQIDNLTNISSIKVTATISKNVVQRKTKSPQQMFVLKVNKTVDNLDKQNYNLTYSNLYGTRIQDQEISLGLTDAYKLHAVYESLDNNDPVIPSITLVEPKFFKTGSVIAGKSSGARARVVEFDSSTLKLTLVYISGKFTLGETVNGVDSNEDAVVGIINDADGSVIEGSKDVTNRYALSPSQTGFMYDCSRLIRLKGFALPIRKLKIVIDYYSHSATGDYFGGQSYLNTSYKDIPFFASKYLADYLDFRPGIKSLYNGDGTVASPAFVNCSTFDFKSRVFNVSGNPTGTIFDIPKLDSDFRCDYDWYLSRIDKLFLTPDGDFQVITGKDAEEPILPDDIAEGMLLATLQHKPYGFEPDQDVLITLSENKRFTMRDIGKIETRLNQVEYYTSLNMLESNTLSLELTDADGFNRLKNGFFVDDFTDHSKCEMSDPDFASSLDFQEGSCHPSHYTTNVTMEVNEALSANYQITGPLITLPYTELNIIEQPYASRVENVNPFNVFTYIGRIDLTPASDDWVDTTRIPRRVTNIEGDFNATAERLNVDQNGFAPTQWNSWNTTWRTVRRRRGRTWRSRRRSAWGRGLALMRRRRIITTRGQVRTGIRTQVTPRIDERSLGDSVVARTTIPWIRSRNVRLDVARMKPRTKFYAFFDGKKIDDYITPKLIELIKDPAVDNRTNSTPFVVGETVTGLTSGAKFVVLPPNGFYTYSPYDDTELPASYSSTTALLNVNVLTAARQAAGKSYGNFQVGEIIEGESGARAVMANRRLVSDRTGKFRASFFIPPATPDIVVQGGPGEPAPPIADPAPRWATGTRTIRLTTNETDSRLAGAVDSAAEAEYQASGTLNTLQENVLAIRNADIVRDTVTQSRTVRTTRTRNRQVGWWDPLAQSFLIEEEGGVFVSSVDIYFNTKDTNIPISMQIRTMENGYPTANILPFSDVTIVPEDIQTSETGAIATNFVFRAPVYIPPSIEHCFVLFSDSNEYKVWISRMGEVDITGDRTISEQPYAGVLFKSQNATTWTADQYEDLKFNLYRADFDTTATSTVVFNNAELDIGNNGKLKLRSEPVQTFQPSLKLVLNDNSLNYTIGARLYQKTTLSEGTITAITDVGSVRTLTINDVSGAWQAGSDTGGVITNRIVSSKTTATLVVTGTSGDFTVGETITGNSSTAPTAEIVTWTSGTNTLTLKYVSTEFTPSTETITGGTSGATATVNTIAYSGDTTTGSPASITDSYATTTPTYATSEKLVRILHSNHGMHDLDNNVTIEGITSEINPTFLTSSISTSDLSVLVNDAIAFHSRIDGANIGVSNLGYIKIEDEIMSYSAVSSDGKTITVSERGVAGTTAVAHADETVVECYNLDGIPLTEINKTHSNISNPTLDSYDITTTSISTSGIVSGGITGIATQNLQYEIIVPSLQTMILPNTEINARINTVTGTSINDGVQLSQNSFVNNGLFQDVVLGDDNYFDEPQMICSKVNEDAELAGAKSFRMDVSLTSTKSNITPVIDTDRMSATLVSSRINSPVDENTALLSSGDTHDAVYISKVASLSNTSTSLKVLFAGFRPPGTTIKVLYRTLPTGSTGVIEDEGYNFFSTAAGDATIPGTDETEIFRDYEYEATGLDFVEYQIKVVFVSDNQAYAPYIKDLRAIALAV